ncbi:hypothetical protein [Paenibacillus sp. 1781tsa1]|uniref:hypothetical protein n=1 Tax=Paenibacillus sp. 1781tsa1 TaxID=2953810 RepID=UPI0020A04381|nr:hypothetical protein [Paenibacillus sp. 1781tsa1]MCP1185063.1 hypothetical protein [Paenibacillus sp. 1781tsa1]
MKKVLEYIHVTYHYESREEREDHVLQMESEGWECNGQIKETASLHTGEYVYCGKFVKYNPFIR